MTDEQLRAWAATQGDAGAAVLRVLRERGRAATERDEALREASAMIGLYRAVKRAHAAADPQTAAVLKVCIDEHEATRAYKGGR